MLEQDRDELHGVGAGEQGFHGVGRGVDAPGHGERAAQQGREDGEPAQAQQQFVGVGQLQLRLDLDLLEVDVRLVKAVEEHEAGGAGEFEGDGELGDGGVERRKLHRDRDVHRSGQGVHGRNHLLFHLIGGDSGVGDDLIQVELDRIRARVFQALGKADPAARMAAVQRGDDRDRQGLFEIGELDEIAFRSELVVGELGVAGGGFRRMPDREPELLLEQRPHRHGGRAGVLQFAGDVDVVAERRRADDERAVQGQSQIRGREIHGGDCADDGRERGGRVRRRWPNARRNGVRWCASAAGRRRSRGGRTAWRRRAAAGCRAA